MDELKALLNSQADAVEKLAGELRAGLRPAIDNFIGFFHAVDWKEPWLMCLFVFQFALLLTAILTRRNDKAQFSLSILAFCGIYFAERLNNFLRENWRSFSKQNYFDPHGLFLSVFWSGPLLLISMLVVINTLYTLCRLIVKWKRAELRHRAKLVESKLD
ncbi:transmembrane protein 18-like [Dioscorea cayenensis subsp. rotundata]|uniref:Transmembrane protein 18 n=1 Tax=Dioscorea cayennensis subsp. rotundata TaxID=55577 RepID=A0AB40CIX5_DIOCR|nr:transmembrane protein 18-like [Dioscorea cayenensis subsp. rotundata]